MEALLSETSMVWATQTRKDFCQAPQNFHVSTSSSSLHGLGQVVSPFCPHFSLYKLEGSDASHEGCWEDSVDNEPHFPQVLTTAKAAQSCSHAQHPHGMGKMESCWMCSNLLPVQTIDIPEFTGSISTFSSKSKVVCFLWNKKNLLACLLMTESLGKQESPLHKASHSLRRDKTWGEGKHFNKLSREVLEERQILQWWMKDKRLSWMTATFHFILQGNHHVPFFQTFKIMVSSSNTKCLHYKGINKLFMNLSPQRQIYLNSIFMVSENQRCVDKFEVI